ncbi:type II toxin-antitoxin system HicA family toxin [Comamonas testosteroni]|uniref:type II toxin-antitoxin system HicA family toxin n=1 Tax=Comamonas testosteroni TaxID=285 RepID=UPI0036F34AB2
MSKQEKMLIKMCRVPPPSDLRWDDMVTVLEALGYEQYKTGKTGGSRRRFVHRVSKVVILCHEPHPSPNVDKGCVVQVVEHLRDQGLIEE